MKDHSDLLAPQRPDRLPGGLEQVQPLKENGAGELRLGVAQQPRQGHGGHRLSAAGLAHQAQNLPFIHVQGDSLHRLPPFRRVAEANVEVLNV